MHCGGMMTGCWVRKQISAVTQHCNDRAIRCRLFCAKRCGKTPTESGRRWNAKVRTGHLEEQLIAACGIFIDDDCFGRANSVEAAREEDLADGAAAYLVFGCYLFRAAACLLRRGVKPRTA